MPKQFQQKRTKLEAQHSQTSDNTTKPQYKNNMVLAQKQIYGSIEHTRKPRNKPEHQWTINQKRQEYTIGKGQSLQQVVLEKLDRHM